MFDRFLSVLVVAVCALAFGPWVPASAQEVLVQNGATVQVSHGGTWHLQGATMDFGDVGATTWLAEVNDGRVTGGTLTVTRKVGSPSSTDPAGLGAILSASNDLGNVTVTRGHTVQTGGGNQSIERYYDLSATGTNSGLSATLTHSYHDAELNGLSESGLELFKSTDGGATWSQEGADSRDPSANTVTLSGIDSFSRWTLGGSGSPLPVELASFHGTTTESGVKLTWRTATETGNAGFRIERTSAQGHGKEGEWVKVGFVDGTGTAHKARSYRFTDEDLPYAPDSLSYRLKQVNVGGSVQVSDPITIDRGAVERLALKKTFPNPVRTQVTVRYAVPENTDAQDVRVRLYDILGRQVQTVVAGAEPGRHEVQVSVTDLASGVYVLLLRANGRSRSRRMTVVR